MATITHKPGESFKEFRQRVINASKAAKEAKDAEYARLKNKPGLKAAK